MEALKKSLKQERRQRQACPAARRGSRQAQTRALDATTIHLHDG